MWGVSNIEIRRYLNLPIVDSLAVIDKVDALGISTNTLMFINKPGIDLTEYDNSTGCIYLINESYPEHESEYNDFIKVSNPKYWFCKIVERFELKSRVQLEFTCDSDQWYRRSENTLIDKYCHEVIVGENCQIDPGVILGGTDFSPVIGMTPDELIQFPQLGGVILEDNVTIKYNTMIGKGTFRYTRIGSNTMIDFGCQIGHNCVIGKSCIIAAGTIIGGSTIVGNNTVIGMGAKIRNGICIGKNVSIGMGAVVIRDVPDNTVVVGNPAHIIEHKPMFDEGGLV